MNYGDIISAYFSVIWSIAVIMSLADIFASKDFDPEKCKFWPFIRLNSTHWTFVIICNVGVIYTE